MESNIVKLCLQRIIPVKQHFMYQHAAKIGLRADRPMIESCIGLVQRNYNKKRHTRFQCLWSSAREQRRSSNLAIKLKGNIYCIASVIFVFRGTKFCSLNFRSFF